MTLNNHLLRDELPQAVSMQEILDLKIVNEVSLNQASSTYTNTPLEGLLLEISLCRQSRERLVLSLSLSGTIDKNMREHVRFLFAQSTDERYVGEIFPNIHIVTSIPGGSFIAVDVIDVRTMQVIHCTQIEGIAPLWRHSLQEACVIESIQTKSM